MQVVGGGGEAGRHQEKKQQLTGDPQHRDDDCDLDQELDDDLKRMMPSMAGW